MFSADDCCHPDHGDRKMPSWWHDTPWSEIREHVRLTLSRAKFEAWLERPDAIERRLADAGVSREEDQEPSRPMKGYQILITPGMAKAGVDAFLGFDTEDLRYSEPELIVRLIYQAMDAARGP